MAKRRAKPKKPAPPPAAAPAEPGGEEASPPAEPEKVTREMMLVDSGIVTGEIMRKVFGQSDRLDKGPTERRLREMLKKGVRPYLDLMEEMEGRKAKEEKREAEVAKLRAENAELKLELSRLKSAEEGPGGEDANTMRSRNLIERILAETHDG